MHLLSTTPLWMTSLKLADTYTAEILQGVINTYVAESRNTVTAGWVPEDSELILMLWPDSREGYEEPSVDSCEKTAKDLARLLGAEVQPYTLGHTELFTMMGRRIDGYEKGSEAAPIEAISHHKDALSMKAAHMVSARAKHSGEIESYGEPTVILRGGLQSIIHIHAIGDELKQHHYAISHGAGVTEFYQTHWAE